MRGSERVSVIGHRTLFIVAQAPAQAPAQAQAQTPAQAPAQAPAQVQAQPQDLEAQPPQP